MRWTKATALSGALLLGGLPFFAAPHASAQTSTVPAAVIVTTPYPKIRVQPGATVSFDISVGAPTPQTVNLAVTGTPPGWKTTMRGGGFFVSAVTAGGDRTTTATLEIAVPPDAKAGPYAMTVQGNGPGGASALGLEVTVDEAAQNAIDVTADFPQLTGSPTDTFSYTLSVKNNTPVKQSFSFDTEAPTGWDVTASPSSESRASSTQIEPGQSASVAVSAKPPADVTAGDYDITVKITAANGASGAIPLVAKVTGKPSMKLTTADERLNVSARSGKTVRRSLKVTNDGTAALENVTFSSSPPTDWEVTFTPDRIESLEPGKEQEVIASIKVSGDTVAGDYALSMSSTAGTATSDVALRVAVKTSRAWGFVGIGIIVVALGALAGIFRRYGRR